IASGHAITLTQDQTCRNLTINSGGIINQDYPNVNVYLYVNGDYINNGQHNNIYQDRFQLNGDETEFGGTGTINMYNTGWYLRMNNGNKIIPTGTNLTVNGDIYVFTGVSVSNNATITIFNSLTGTATSSWVNASNSTLNIGNVLFANGVLYASSAGNTINYYRSGAQTVKVPSANKYYNLIISGSDVKTLAGDIKVQNDITISSILDAVNYTIEMGGDWTNTGDFIPGSGTVTFNGTELQTINNDLGEIFNNLIINKASGNLELNDNVLVALNLTMSLENIKTNNSVLTLGTSESSIGILNYTDGNIDGAFERWVNSTETEYMFPIGTASYYRPVSLSFNNLSSGSVKVEFMSEAPGNNGLVPLDDDGTNIYNTFTEGFWKLTPANSFASSDYNIEVTANGFSSFGIDSDTRLITRSNSGEDWLADGSHVTAVGNVIKRDNVSTIGAEFALGDDFNCSPPVSTNISGSNSVCKNNTGKIYYVTNTPGNTYQWTITGGSQASGTQTNSITVNWGYTGMAGNVRVIETLPGCGSGDPVDLPVNINAIPTSAIVGKNQVSENTAGVTYSVTDNGYTYNWTITGGSITSGTGTANITVNWGVAGSGSVAVVGQYSSGCSDNATQVSLAVTINEEVYTVASGNWNNTATWNVDYVPTSSDNVRIANGHTVTLAQNETVNNLVIDNGGTLTQTTYYLYVYGDYTINGIHSIAQSDRLRLYGNGTAIDGTGTISMTNVGYYIRAYNGNKTIANSANINFNGDLYINTGITIVNNGVFRANDIFGQAASSTFTNNTNASLYVENTMLTTGTLNASSTGNTIVYNGTVAQNVKTASDNKYYNLSIAGSNTKTLAGNATILNDLTISSTLNASTYSIIINGDWTTTGDFVPGTGSVTFKGTTDQELTNTLGEGFNNLIINKSSGILFLNDDVQVANTLTMSNGNINTSGNILTLGSSVGSIGILSRSSGRVIGKFEKWVSATGSYLMPVGTSSYYRPITIDFNNVNGGSIIAEFIGSTPGNTGLPLVDGAETIRNTFNEGYWKLTPANSLS
ncbi:MAG: hypothetical protein V1904_14810, partial [Bacteroidota bacterium]